jgi:hypothetical protein
MARFFTRERFGRPQFLAGLLLLAFVAQCLWLISRGLKTSGLDSSELYRVQQGLHRWHGETDTATLTAQPPVEVERNEGYDPNHSAFYYLIAGVPLLAWPLPMQPEQMAYWAWLVRLPYPIFGALLGASLWYVARRLYGNAGGYIALVLYCFCPGMLRASAGFFAQPEVTAAWGAFGAVFTAIAVAHTLYAPREVVLWNWRRILLLGLSLAMAIGCQFSLIVLLPIALLFMLYLAPSRRGAALVIWTASCLVALFLLYASYFFHPGALLEGMRHASFFRPLWQALGMSGAYRQLAMQLGENSPALWFALPAILATYAWWRRARYFGNTAPLLVSAVFLGLALVTPHYPGFGFQLMALPFLFVFIAGVTSDLLETRHRNLVLACTWGMLGAYAISNLVELARVGMG